MSFIKCLCNLPGGQRCCLRPIGTARLPGTKLVLTSHVRENSYLYCWKICSGWCSNWLDLNGLDVIPWAWQGPYYRHGRHTEWHCLGTKLWLLQARRMKRGRAKPEWPIKSIEKIFTLVMAGNHVYEGMGLSKTQKRATMCWWAQQLPSTLFRDRISLQNVALAGLEIRPAGFKEQPASAVSGLALKVCATMPSVESVFFFFNLPLWFCSTAKIENY